MKKNDEEIEIVIGDDSNLQISEVGDYTSDLKPKTNKLKKNFVIPLAKKKKDNKDNKK